jgi:mono/diheme cytochrome c family protein
LLLLAGCASGAGPEAPAPAPPEPRPTPAEPGTGAAATPALSYTTEQAEQGREVFNTVCAACHAVGEFRGQMFQISWRARPIGDFLQFIATAMPQDRPGTLSPEQYAAVVAYVLQLNGYPPGAAELPADVKALAAVGWPR